MRIMLTVLPLIATAPALAQQDAQDNATIVVTGTPIDESARRLRDCLARHCPPREDIDASLAHAENQFIAGDYQAARETLAASHNRNRRFAAQYPTDVADLSRAYGRMTNLSGYPEQGRILQIDSLDVLKEGLASDDSRVLMQRLTTGDEYVKQGRVTAGEEVYRKVEKQARAAGRLDVAGAAMLRPAMVYVTLAKINAGYADDARARIRRVTETREPELAPYRDAAKILAARLAGEGKDMTAFDKAMADLADQRTDHPVLVYSAPMELIVSELGEELKVSYDTAPQWMDVRYRIGLDGRVEDVDVLRTSKDVDGNWRDVALKAVAKRRYLPLALKNGANGLVRVERFSYVFDVSTTTGSRMGVRNAAGRISSLDITAEPAEPQTDKGG